MRELNHNTAKVVQEVVESGEPALVTKHGRFVLVLSPVPESVESAVIGAALGRGLDRERSFGRRSIDAGKTAEEAAEELGLRIPARGFPDREVE